MFIVGGMSVERDHRVTESVKKQLLSSRLSESVPSVMRLLTVTN